MKIYKRLGSNLSWLLCQSSKRARTRTRFTGADWCHCKGKNNFAPLTIPKGNGKYKYPASSFEFVKFPYRRLVLQVEERLAEIRSIASENRQLRRTLVAYERKLSRYQALDHGDFYSEE